MIVIIGILATLSTATFSSMQAKARDKQREAFVRNGQQIVLGSQTGVENPDYRMGGDDVSSVVDGMLQELREQGYNLPIAENGIGYYLFLQSSDITTDLAQRFMLFSCQQDKLGSTTGDARDVGYLSGNADLNSAITDANARAACGDTPTDPVLNTGWACINLSDRALCS